MLESEYDLDYRSVPQKRGNSDIRHIQDADPRWLLDGEHDDHVAPTARDLENGRTRCFGGTPTRTPGLRPDPRPRATGRRRTPQPLRHDVVDPPGGRWTTRPRPGTPIPTSPHGVAPGFFGDRYTPDSHLRPATSCTNMHDAIASRDNLVVEHWPTPSGSSPRTARPSG